MNAEGLKQQFVPKYINDGKDKFYRYLLLCQLNKLILIKNGTYRGASPEIEFLDYYDRFLLLYRREGEDGYLDIAKLFRRAAHKIYRVLLKKNMTTHNARFLNSV